MIDKCDLDAKLAYSLSPRAALGMPRFWFGLGGLRGWDAIRAQEDLDSASVAPTEVVSHV